MLVEVLGCICVLGWLYGPVSLLSFFLSRYEYN